MFSLDRFLIFDWLVFPTTHALTGYSTERNALKASLRTSGKTRGCTSLLPSRFGSSVSGSLNFFVKTEDLVSNAMRGTLNRVPSTFSKKEKSAIRLAWKENLKYLERHGWKVVSPISTARSICTCIGESRIVTLASLEVAQSEHQKRCRWWQSASVSIEIISAGASLQCFGLSGRTVWTRVQDAH